MDKYPSNGGKEKGEKQKFRNFWSHLTEEDLEMTNDHTRCLTSLATSGLQIKAQLDVTADLS